MSAHILILYSFEIDLSNRNCHRPSHNAISSKPAAARSSPVQTASKTEKKKTDILVAGAVALDLSCDYAGRKAGDVAPQAHTSNPANISQSVGGVGHNVALAAHRASAKNHVKLCSMVGDDV